MASAGMVSPDIGNVTAARCYKAMIAAAPPLAAATAGLTDADVERACVAAYAEFGRSFPADADNPVGDRAIHRAALTAFLATRPPAAATPTDEPAIAASTVAEMLRDYAASDQRKWMKSSVEEAAQWAEWHEGGEAVTVAAATPKLIDRMRAVAASGQTITRSQVEAWADVLEHDAPAAATATEDARFVREDGKARPADRFAATPSAGDGE
jgi:hypothetical protein